MDGAACLHLVAQAIGQAAQRRDVHAAMRQLQIGNRGQRRLAPVQLIRQTLAMQPLVYGGQPLGTFRVAVAHIVFAAVAVKKVSGLAHGELAFQKIQVTSRHGRSTHTQKFTRSA